MGYRCPVCDDPQADDVHLANHLAFTALVRGGDHEAWLDEHVPEWEQLDDTGLADAVTELADDAAYPQVFEDTTDQHSHDHQHDLDRQHDHQHSHDHGHDHQHSHDHGHDHQHSHGHDHQHSHGYDTDSPQIPTVSDTGQLDEEAREILREAQELTRERRERDSTDDSSKEGAGAESSSEPDAETELDTDTNSSADN